jgi:hypothetical protein
MCDFIIALLHPSSPKKRRKIDWSPYKSILKKLKDLFFRFSKISEFDNPIFNKNITRFDVSMIELGRVLHEFQSLNKLNEPF